MRRVLRAVGRYVWLPALILLAIDLTVPREQSVLRPSASSANYTVRHAYGAEEGSAGDHIYFGLEDTPTTTKDIVDTRTSTSLGAWSGEFEASLPVEEDARCWSPASIRMNLASGMQCPGR
jgi:hypothetical protein